MKPSPELPDAKRSPDEVAEEPGGASPLGRLAHLAAAVVVVLAVFALYREALGHSFFQDDFKLLLRARNSSPTQIFAPSSEEWFWRPGWRLLFILMIDGFGLHAPAYMTLSVCMHAVVCLLVYGVTARVTGSVVHGLFAALLFGSSPSYVEAVVWPSAAFEVIPAAALLIGSCASLVWFVRDGGARRWAAGFVLFVLALLFKEAAYHVPLVLAGAWLLLRPRDRRGLSAGIVSLLPFAAVILAHYLGVRRDEEAWGVGLVPGNLASYAASLALVPGAGAGTEAPAAAAIALAAGTVAMIAIAVAGRPLTRVLALWTAASLFPYVMVIATPRFVYFPAIASSMCLLSFARDLELRWGRRRVRWPALALLVVAIGVQARRLPGEMEPYRAQGELARRILDCCRGQELERFERVYAGFSPARNLHPLEYMLRLYFEDAPEFVRLWVVSRPPFVVYEPDYGHPGWRPAQGESRAAYLRIDPETGACALVARNEVFPPGSIPLPMFSFRRDYRIVADREAARERLVAGEIDPDGTVLLSEDPGIPAREGPRGTHRIVKRKLFVGRRVVLRVDCSEDTLLVTSFFLVSRARRVTATVDGEPARVLDADGALHAVVVPAGERVVTFTAVKDETP